MEVPSGPLLVLYLVVGAMIVSTLAKLFGSDKRNGSVSDSLHSLRDEGARAFVNQLVYRLKRAAASGRSDYEFRFRPFDLWFESRTFFLFFTVPWFVSYWDCIDSPGSREVVKKMLEGEGKGLRVDWSISTYYGQSPFAPKWVLSCQWDRLELRRNQFGGR
jgi:hypothetical protein